MQRSLGEHTKIEGDAVSSCPRREGPITLNEVASETAYSFRYLGSLITTFDHGANEIEPVLGASCHHPSTSWSMEPLTYLPPHEVRS